MQRIDANHNTFHGDDCIVLFFLILDVKNIDFFLNSGCRIKNRAASRIYSNGNNIIKNNAYGICDSGKLMMRSGLIGNVSDLKSSDPGSNPGEVTLDKEDKDKGRQGHTTKDDKGARQRTHRHGK